MNEKIDSDFFTYFFTIAVKMTDNKELGKKIGERLADDFYLRLNLRKPEFKDIPSCINLFFKEYFNFDVNIDNLNQGIENLNQGIDNLNQGIDNLNKGIENIENLNQSIENNSDKENPKIVVCTDNGREFVLTVNYIGFYVFYECLKTIFEFLIPNLNVFVRNGNIIFSLNQIN